MEKIRIDFSDALKGKKEGECSEYGERNSFITVVLVARRIRGEPLAAFFEEHAARMLSVFVCFFC